MSGHSVYSSLGGHRNCKGAFHGDSESDCSGAVCDTHADVSLLAVAENEPTTNICQPDSAAGIGVVLGFPLSGIRDPHRDAVGLAFYAQAHEPATCPHGHTVLNSILDQGLNRKNRNRGRQGVSIDLQFAAKFWAEAQLLDL